MNDAIAEERPELTVRAIVLGAVLSVVMGAANVYVGLKTGLTVSAAIPASVAAMLVFRFVFRRPSILEANQVQTAASAGESLAAGIIFTMPALVLVGFWKELDYWTVTLVAAAGGTLGVLFMIPMRAVFIAGRSDLPYPEGVACAAVLEAGAAEGSRDTDARPLVLGTTAGLVFTAVSSFTGLVRGALEGAASLGRVFYAGASVSPMLVAVGAIVRLNVAVLISIGSAIGWLVIIPLLSAGDWNDPLETAERIWSTRVRYVGVGAMVVGGAHSICRARNGLVHAMRALSSRTRAGGDDPEAARDLSARTILVLGGITIGTIGWLYLGFTGSVGVTLVALLAAVLMSFFFTAVACYIVGLVGNTNSPVSGMTITAVLFTGLCLSAFGYGGTEGMVAILGVAAIVCCVACTAGDTCNDLKTGQMVGATPWRQELMQIIGVIVAAFVMAPVLTLLHRTAEGGIGGRELPAPQAGLFASLARALAGHGELPMNMVWLGVGIGVAVVAIDVVLERRHSPFRAHLMPIAVGIYLPFKIAPPMLVGGLLAHALERGSREQTEARQHRATLFASGVIAGESIMGIGVAALAGMGVKFLGFAAPGEVTLGITVGAIAAFLILFWSESRRTRRT